MSLNHYSWPALQAPSSSNSIDAPLEKRRHLNGSLQTRACSAPPAQNGNSCLLCCSLWIQRDILYIFLKLLELTLKLLELKEMWKITINRSQFHVSHPPPHHQHGAVGLSLGSTSELLGDLLKTPTSRPCSEHLRSECRHQYLPNFLDDSSIQPICKPLSLLLRVWYVSPHF